MRYRCDNPRCSRLFPTVAGLEPEKPTFLEVRLTTYEIDEDGFTLGLEDEAEQDSTPVICAYCKRPATVLVNDLAPFDIVNTGKLIDIWSDKEGRAIVIRGKRNVARVVKLLAENPFESISDIYKAVKAIGIAERSIRMRIC